MAGAALPALLTPLRTVGRSTPGLGQGQFRFGGMTLTTALINCSSSSQGDKTTGTGNAILEAVRQRTEGVAVGAD